MVVSTRAPLKCKSLSLHLRQRRHRLQHLWQQLQLQLQQPPHLLSDRVERQQQHRRQPLRLLLHPGRRPHQGLSQRQGVVLLRHLARTPLQPSALIVEASVRFAPPTPSSRFNVTASTVAKVSAEPNNGRSHGIICAYSSGKPWRLRKLMECLSKRFSRIRLELRI
jgi:hypothetical protein